MGVANLPLPVDLNIYAGELIDFHLPKKSTMSSFAVRWLVVVFAVSSASVSRQTAKKPNFIIFLMDDVRMLFYNNTAINNSNNDDDDGICYFQHLNSRECGSLQCGSFIFTGHGSGVVL